MLFCTRQSSEGREKIRYEELEGSGEFCVKFSLVNFTLLIAPIKRVRHENHTFNPVAQLLFVERNSASKVAARERLKF
jgi:hypothetical protein